MASRFWAVAVRPRWIAALLLCLGIAAGFAALGQWQLSRSVENADVADAPDTEVAVPLASIAEPQTEVTQPQLGRRVTVDGELVASRLHRAHRAQQRRRRRRRLAGRALRDRRGRHARRRAGLGAGCGRRGCRGGRDADRAVRGPLPAERGAHASPTSRPGSEARSRSPNSSTSGRTRSPPTAAIWCSIRPGRASSRSIRRPRRARSSFNLLNVFYALEWAIFAGFAIYLWYRLVRDVVEREQEERDRRIGACPPRSARPTSRGSGRYSPCSGSRRSSPARSCCCSSS